MKHIDLIGTKEKALVDNEDFELVSGHKWRLYQNGNHKYAITNINNKIISMHRFIMNPKSSLVVDHIDGNGLNNIKSNLRCIEQFQNLFNTNKRLYTTSKYKGVHWSIRQKKWISRICINNKDYYLGRFDKEEDAARAYDIVALAEIGEIAKTNFPADHYKSNEILNICQWRQKKNRKKKSKYKGVTWHKGMRKWMASSSIGKVNKFLGYYDNELNAARAYDQHILSYGNHKLLNFKNIRHIDRLSWDDYFSLLTLVIASRSPDKTKHGCILTDKDNKIIGCGYNGFIKNMPDDLMPTDEDKYLLTIHSEVNSIFNRNTLVEPCSAYITGEPCMQCFVSLAAVGVKRIVIGCIKSVKGNLGNSPERTIKLFNQIIDHNNIEITYWQPNNFALIIERLDKIKDLLYSEYSQDAEKI